MGCCGDSQNGGRRNMNASTLLHRQVHPSWVLGDRVTSQAFRPTPKDKKRLSVYDGDQITAEAAWQHYTNDLGHTSAGVLTVTVGECDNLELPVVPDPATFQEHTLIDFSAFSRRQIETKAKTLRANANLRGWQYRP